MSFSIRRDHIALRKADAAGAPGTVNSVRGVVQATEYQGNYVKVTIEVGGDVFVANVSDRAYFAEPVDFGDSVVASWNTDDVHILGKADTGEAGASYLDDSH